MSREEAEKLLAQGLHDQARELAAELLAENPRNPEICDLLGRIEAAQGFPEAAEAAFRLAMRLAPDVPAYRFHLGNSLGEQGRLEEAEKVYADGRRLGVAGPDELRNHARILFHLDRFTECADALEQSLATDRTDSALPEVWYDLARACRMGGETERGIASCRRGLAVQPDFADLHKLLATLLLLNGEWPEGFGEYEIRLQTYDPCRGSDIPRWRGEELAGRKILIRGEQGMGDAIMMARFLPVLAERGAEIRLECHSCLHRLLAGLAGNIRLLPLGETAEADFQLPMMSLPLVMGTTPEQNLFASPYLFPDPAEAGKWRERLGGGFKVGLVWQGNRNHANDLRRSFPLAAMAPLFAVPDVRFFSLQYEYGREGMEEWPITDLGGELADYTDTAAILANLDILISCDTSTAHLAGAMGVPVWLALDAVNDWRWMNKRPDTPWYPGHRLFRQERMGDWTGIFDQIAREIKSLSARAR